MTTSNPNLASPDLDIKGIDNINDLKDLTDEPNHYGQLKLAGTGASIVNINNNQTTIDGLNSIDSLAEGDFLTLAGSIHSANNGTFSIIKVLSATSVIIENSNAILDSGLNWIQRSSYSAQDNLEFSITDRARIKGVNYYDPIPQYTRPTDTVTSVPANLSNLAGKTTDSRGIIVNILFHNQSVTVGASFTTITNTGNLTHSNSVNKTGIPCFDQAPYLGNFKACYVELSDGYTDNSILVLSGIHTGEKVFGITRVGSSTAPDTVEVVFYSYPHGTDIESNSTLYTWEAGQPSVISLIYGYFKRLDLLDDADLRQGLNGGSSSSSDDQSLTNSFLFGGL